MKMNFRFQIHVSEDDYLEYNKFWVLRSPYGRKSLVGLRILDVVIILIAILLVVVRGGFDSNVILRILPLLLLLVVLQLLLKPFYVFILRNHIKNLKNKGKIPYTPESVMEFHEDFFLEMSPEAKIEQQYSAVERISLVDGKMIYLHMNNLIAYILPVSAFQSEKEREAFIEFIQSKCPNAPVDIY